MCVWFANLFFTLYIVNGILMTINFNLTVCLKIVFLFILIQGVSFEKCFHFDTVNEIRSVMDHNTLWYHDRIKIKEEQNTL